ncbi:hypothetical protein HGB25_00900 [Candidatus Saccharibacteria bacterium]|nr:hypothetical protein [Candidatus Saccharibacteria bacterium]
MAAKKAVSSTKKSTTTKSKTTTSTVKADVAASMSFDTVIKALKNTPLVGKVVAEFVGAFLLTAAFIEMQGNPLFVAFALAGVVLVVGGVSGAHVNPAATVGAWVTRKMNWLSAVSYIAAQLLGAAVAVLVLNTFLKANSLTAAQIAAGATEPTLYVANAVAAGKEWYVFFTELLGASILAFGVASAVKSLKNKTTAAFTAGFAILTALYISMSLTTVLLDKSGVTLTFLNPAIALVSNGLSWNMWPISIYVIAPVLGGVAGFILQDFLAANDNSGCDC